MKTSNWVSLRILLFVAEQMADYSLKSDIAILIREIKEAMTELKKNESA